MEINELNLNLVQKVLLMTVPCTCSKLTLPREEIVPTLMEGTEPGAVLNIHKRLCFLYSLLKLSV